MLALRFDGPRVQPDRSEDRADHGVDDAEDDHVDDVGERAVRHIAVVEAGRPGHGGRGRQLARPRGQARRRWLRLRGRLLWRVGSWFRHRDPSCMCVARFGGAVGPDRSGSSLHVAVARAYTAGTLVRHAIEHDSCGVEPSGEAERHGRRRPRLARRSCAARRRPPRVGSNPDRPDTTAPAIIRPADTRQPRWNASTDAIRAAATSAAGVPGLRRVERHDRGSHGRIGGVEARHAGRPGPSRTTP